MTKAKIEKLYDLVINDIQDELYTNLKRSFVYLIVDKFGTNGIIFTALDQYEAHGRYMYPITHKHYKDLVNFLIYRLKEDMKNRIEIDKTIYGLNDYEKAKAKARQKAIEWQTDFANNNYSWEDLSQKTTYFERLGKRYGLLKEFHENGIC